MQVLILISISMNPGEYGRFPSHLPIKSIDVSTNCIYTLAMKFEWDEVKNEANIRLHGIDFEDIRQVFDGPLIIQLDEREDYGEPRWIGTGFLIQAVVVVVYTERREDTIRIISARKANKHERAKFEKEISHRLG